MIDALSILLTHGLIMLAAWRLLTRDDLDVEPETGQSKPQPQPQVDKSTRPWLANQKYLPDRNHKKQKGAGRDA